MPFEEKKGIRLNLGCGDDILCGYINHDVTQHRPEIDVAHDLTILPWSWADDSAEEIRMLDVLEHLPEVVPIIDECWRVLRPDGVLHIRVPHYQYEWAWLDPTHRRAFHLDSFDYFDPDSRWGAEYGFYTQRKWMVEHKEIRDGNVVVVMRPRKGVNVGTGNLSRRIARYAWAEQVYKATDEMIALIPAGNTLILVDQDEWGTDGAVAGRRCIPFLERDGQYWGLPPDDETAIRELERLRQSGASFMVFAWPAFWWLEYYCGLQRHLRSKFRCVLENDCVVVFDLRA